MTDRSIGLGDVVAPELTEGWTQHEGRLSQFLNRLGLTGDECSQSLYILAVHTSDPMHFIQELRTNHGRPEWEDPGQWAILVADKADGAAKVLAFPVSKRLALVGVGNSQARRNSLLALFIEVHSRLVLWWLVNAWRSRQLAEATWQLADSLKFVPAAACARSLIETAASFWVDARKVCELWSGTKIDYSTHGPSVSHRDALMLELNKLLWGSKFNDKVPHLEKAYGRVQRTNVLSQIDKLARATDSPLQEDYQWLCNAVHPSIGGMLAFAAPIMGYSTESFAFQWVSERPVTFLPIGAGGGDAHVLFDTALSKRGAKDVRQTTIQDAIARSATLAVNVLERTLDDALRVIDDVGLTTRAPTMASFTYWRNIERKSGNQECPCRSGKKAKRCLHRWNDPVPTIADRFGSIAKGSTE